jgi:cell division protein FtsB
VKQFIPSKKVLIASGLLLAAAGSIGMLIFGQRGILELRRLRQEGTTLTRSNDALREHNQLLQRQIGSLRDDPAAVERVARERLGMIKDGEVVYYLPDKAPAPPVAPPVAPKEQPKR